MLRIIACLVAGLVFSASPATADNYPSRPIRVLVAFPAGGVSDVVARIVAEGMRSELGTPVFVENKAGGAGIIGIRELIQAKPDGYTVLLGGFGGQVLGPLLAPRFPFDVTRDLVPLSQVTEFINVLVVTKGLPVGSFQEFLEYAKAHPGQLNYGSEGAGTSTHVATEMFLLRSGIKMVHLPYKGAPAALTDLMTGAIQVMFVHLPAVLGLIQSDSVKVLAVTSSHRSPILPGVPTIAESGLPGFHVTSWNGVFGPSGLSGPIKSKLSDALIATARDPGIQNALQKIGAEAVGTGPDAFEQFFRSELTRWKEVITQANIKKE